MAQWQNILNNAFEAEILKVNLNLIKKGQDFILANNFFLNPPQNIKILLDPKKTAQENLEYKFKQIKRAKRAILIIHERLNIIKSEIDKLKNNIENSNREELNDIIIPKKYKRLPYKTFLSSDNIEILVGKSAKDSDTLTLKLAKGNYWWFHIKDQVGAHVVVKYSSDLPPKTFIEAAMLSAYFSKSKNDMKPEVTYTKVKYIRKPKNLKAGAVLIKNEKNILIEINKAILSKLLLSKK